ncbi:MAG: HAD-IA family hydrolase [Gammaproteobacteria bacterium]|nr:HAD-IA family hydrolase [Gammaproteobacteria bacterium]
MPLKLLIFDWDGTLVNSTAHIVFCVQQAAAELNQPIPEDIAIKKVIGLGLVESIDAIAPGATPNERATLMQKYREIYWKTWDEAVIHPETLFEGVLDVLKILQGEYQLAIATGKHRQGLEKSLKIHNLSSFFISTRTADETESKPSPRMLYELLKEMRVGPEEALMIGDTEYDLEMATSAKVPALAVSYGTRSREQLLPFAPVGCIDTIKELIPWLKQYDHS